MKYQNYRALTAKPKKKAPYILQDFRKHGRMNLQLFAEEGGDEGAGDGGKDEGGEDPGDGKDGKKDEKGDKDEKGGKRTYDDAEVDRIVAKHRAEWEKAHKKEVEDAREEARKYERMTKEQREAADKKKAEEEAAKKDARIKELENQIATDALRKSVASDVESMPEGIQATQDFLDLVVTGDADTANANVQKLVGIILADRRAQEEKRAAGRTPKQYHHDGGGATDPYSAIANKYNKR